MKKIKKLPITLLLSMVIGILFTVSIGFSIWLISDKIIIEPELGLDDIINGSIDGEAIYNGQVIVPSLDGFGLENDDFLEYTYSYLVDGSKVTIDAENNIGPINAGEYKIIVDYTYTYNGIDPETGDEIQVTKPGSVEKDFTIKPKPITLEWGNKDLTYNGDFRAPSYTTSEDFEDCDNGNVSIQLDGERKEVGENIILRAFLDGNASGNYILINNVTTYNINPIFIVVDWKKLSFVYNGKNQSEELEPEDILIYNEELIVDGDECSFQVNFDKELINAGDYNATYELIGKDSGNYSITPSTKLYRIEKATVTYVENFVKVDAITNSNGTQTVVRTPDKITTNALNGIRFKVDSMNLEFGYSDENYNKIFNSFSIDEINNYIEQYVSTDSDYTTVNAVGSVYETRINSVCTSNFKLTEEKFYIKYATVKVGSNYFTIEDAIKQNEATIILIGDYNNYYITSFTKTDFYKNNSEVEREFTLDKDIIKVSATENAEEFILSGSTPDNVYSVLKIPNGIQINLTNSSELIACGNLNQGAFTTSRGVIMNDGLINVEGSTVKSYGYIKSSSYDSNGDSVGKIVLKDAGSKAVDCMAMFDWPGGNTATKLKDEALPLNAWSVHNISCNVEIKNSAEYSVFVYQKVSRFDVDGEYSIINGSGNPLFKCNGTGIIIKKTSNAQNKTESTNKSYASDKSLSNINGSNQKQGQRDLIFINGNYIDNEFSVEVASVSLSTSPNISCPLGFMSVILESGELRLENSDYLFLPGTFFEVKKGAKLIVKENIDLSFESGENLDIISNETNKSKLFLNYCVDKDPAYLKVSGIIENNGNIGGLIEAGANEVTISFTSSTANVSSEYISLYHAIGRDGFGNLAYSVKNMSAFGYIIDQASGVVKSGFTKSSYTSTSVDGKYYWVGEQGPINETKVVDPTAVNIPESSGSCLAEGTLITMADGTKIKVEDIKPGDKLLVFNHETGKYDIAEVLFNDSEDISTYTVINLEFSNNSIVKVISEHGFFDLDLMKYVYIDEYNYKDYIGHRFVSAVMIDGEMVQSIVTLDKAYLTEEFIRVYSPVTKYHMNYITEDILSMPGGISGLFNIFEYDDNLQYNQELMEKDIKEYGLFTYEDFKDLVSYELYSSFATQYFKVAIAKGYLTWEQLYYYIERYGPLV